MFSPPLVIDRVEYELDATELDEVRRVYLVYAEGPLPEGSVRESFDALTADYAKYGAVSLYWGNDKTKRILGTHAINADESGIRMTPHTMKVPSKDDPKKQEILIVMTVYLIVCIDVESSFEPRYSASEAYYVKYRGEDNE